MIHFHCVTKMFVSLTEAGRAAIVRLLRVQVGPGPGGSGSRWVARHLARQRERSFDGFDLRGEEMNYAGATHQGFLR